jgi:hypothetical protein
MRTPAGKECSYFYGDYFRGRDHEECRLLLDEQPNITWTPDLCQTCPVPEIQRANACQHMVLKATVTRPFPFIKRRMTVRPYCTKSHRDGFDPHIGCGQCHELPDVFSEVS